MDGLGRKNGKRYNERLATLWPCSQTRPRNDRPDYADGLKGASKTRLAGDATKIATPARPQPKGAVGSLDAAILDHRHHGRDIFEGSTVGATLQFGQIESLDILLR
jgi:hypothetical protein